MEIHQMFFFSLELLVIFSFIYLRPSDSQKHGKSSKLGHFLFYDFTVDTGVFIKKNKTYRLFFFTFNI